MTTPTLADEIAAVRYIVAHFRDIWACFPDIDAALNKEAVASALARLEAMRSPADHLMEGVRAAMIDAARTSPGLIGAHWKLLQGVDGKRLALAAIEACFPTPPEPQEGER